MLREDQIVNRLKNKGMIFKDEEDAKNFFSSNGYYRFRGYFYDCLDLNSNCKENGKKFQPKVCFEDIKIRFLVDGTIKSGLFDATQYIELSLRERIVVVLGKYGEVGYLNKNNFGSHQGSNFNKKFDQLIKKMQDIHNKSTAPFIKNKNIDFNKTPIWKMVEILDFGCLSTLLKLMKDADVIEVASFFGYDTINIFRSHVMLVNKIRNMCAHHHILWHRGISPSVKPTRDMVGFVNNSSCIYNDIIILFHFTKNISTEWLSCIYFICITLTNSIDLKEGYGFPDKWEKSKIWESSTVIKMVLENAKNTNSLKPKK